MSLFSTRIMSVAVLTLLDIAMFFLSFYVSSQWVYGSPQLGSNTVIAVIELSTLLTVYLFGGYVIRRQLSFIHIPAQMSIAVLLAAILVTVAGYVSKLYETDVYLWRTQFIAGMSCIAVWLIISRVILRVVIQRITDLPVWGVLGNKKMGKQIEKDMLAVYGEGKFRYFNKLSTKLAGDLHGLIVLPDAIDSESANSLIDIRMSGTRIFNVEEFYERFLFKVPLQFLRKSWFATSAEFSLLHHEVALRVKRIIDVLLSIPVLILCMPIMLLAALLVFLYDRGPVFYSQIRTGVNGQTFRLYKFRSMIPDAEKSGQAQWAQKKDNRITPIGNILRLTRIDELPQLINVLSGDMSFIGPRPERPSFVVELEKAIPLYQYRHAIKPGITGWAQVMYPYGASQADAERKLEYDLYYIRNYSLMLDIYIVLRTIRVVLFGKGR